MKTMQNLFNNKKGFTLVEMIITTLILSILMGVTMGMITSSGKLFSSNAELATDKMIGDAIFQTLESSTKYATHVELANSKAQCSKVYDQGFNIQITNEKTNSGKLVYNSKSKNKNEYTKEPFLDSFYQGRTVKYIVEPYKYSDNKISEKHISITVIVCRDGKEVYKRGPKTVKCINLGLLGEGESSNLIVRNYNNKENQYINFSCDEQLVLSEVDGFETSSESSKTLSIYNEINNVLVASLNEAYVTYTDDEHARLAAMNEAANKARNEIKELFGGYVPTAKFNKNGPLRFFNGVEATKEEVFYGNLMKNHSVNGKVTPESYPKFKDPENYFSHSTFTAYGGNMVQLVLYYMNEGSGFNAENNTYTPSQINDYNVYSVKWGEWFDDWNSYSLSFFHGITKTTHTINLNDPKNVLGWTNWSKKSYNEAYIVYHPLRNTWYYQPDRSTTLSVWWNYAWGIDDKPLKYDVSKKSSTSVMMDIDSNIVGEYEENVWIGFGSWRYKINKINHSTDTLWNALPAQKIDSPG